jgi:hypothetical protein
MLMPSASSKLREFNHPVDVRRPPVTNGD